MMLLFKASLCLKAFFTLLNCVFLYRNNKLSDLSLKNKISILKKTRLLRNLFYFWTKLGPNRVTCTIFPEIF